MRGRPRVLPDEEAQCRLVTVFQRHLRATSSSAKPDLRLLDAIDNEVEAVNTDRVLVYDRPVDAKGLRWADLQRWWRETQGFRTAAEAKGTLCARLRSRLPENSPPQRLLFDAYHALHGAQMPERPALLPEAWRHWDPKTMSSRGEQALVGHRMDFLLLLPHSRRVVIEVDGRHHYSTDGQPDAVKYAQQAAEDRALKLHGYDVYRFGGAELPDKATARQVMTRFLNGLWQHHGLPTLPGH